MTAERARRLSTGISNRYFIITDTQPREGNSACVDFVDHMKHSALVRVVQLRGTAPRHPAAFVSSTRGGSAVIINATATAAANFRNCRHFAFETYLS